MVDLCRDAGISQGTFYQWKAKYSGMDSSQLRNLKDLDAEVLRYLWLFGQQALQITVFDDVVPDRFNIEGACGMFFYGANSSNVMKFDEINQFYNGSF